MLDYTPFTKEQDAIEKQRVKDAVKSFVPSEKGKSKEEEKEPAEDKSKEEPKGESDESTKESVSVIDDDDADVEQWRMRSKEIQAMRRTHIDEDYAKALSEFKKYGGDNAIRELLAEDRIQRFQKLKEEIANTYTRDSPLWKEQMMELFKAAEREISIAREVKQHEY